MAPSQFLNELGKGNVRVLGQKPSSYTGEKNKKDPLESKYCRGRFVYNDDYGHGQIIGTSKSEDGEFVVTVKFETGGIKKFLPKYQSSSLLVED